MKAYQCNHKMDRLCLNKRSRVYVLLCDIVVLKGQANYTTFVLSDGREKIVPHTLRYFEAYLSDFGFQRVHRSSMINAKYIRDYQEQSSIVTLNNGMVIPVSRRRKSNLQAIENKKHLCLDSKEKTK